MNSISVSKYMTYNPLFNVSSFLQTTSNHSPSSTSSTCSTNSSNSFSPNSSINAHSQCSLPASLNPSTLLSAQSQYLSNSNLQFNSSFCASTSPTNSNLLRLNSPNDLQASLAQAQLAAQLTAVVAVNGNNNNSTSSESPVTNQTSNCLNASPQLTSLALKQAALAALQTRSNSSNQLLNNNRLEQPNSLLITSSNGQFSGNYTSKSSFNHPSKSFYYNSLKASPSSSAFQQPSSSPNVEIMNLSNDQFKQQTAHLSPQSASYNGQTNLGTISSFMNAVNSTEQQPTKSQLDPNLQSNLLNDNNNSEKTNSILTIPNRNSPKIQLTNLTSLDVVSVDHCPKSKHKTNRQGKSVRKSNPKDEFGFSKVLKY